MRCIVIGAGLLGLTTAWFLRRSGVEVTVIERGMGPALETSFANGGMLHASQASPWNEPGVVWQALRTLGHEGASRVLDVKRALEALKAPKGLRASFGLEVADWVVQPKKALAYTVQLEGGAVRVRPGAGRQALRCDINTFTRLDSLFVNLKSHQKTVCLFLNNEPNPMIKFQA